MFCPPFPLSRLLHEGALRSAGNRAALRRSSEGGLQDGTAGHCQRFSRSGKGVRVRVRQASLIIVKLYSIPTHIPILF